MRPHVYRLIALSLVLFAVSTSVGAGYFTVTLRNGTTFDTRQQPVEAEWDPNVSMFLTDQGNWIALANDEIVDVVSAAEESGFGYQLDTTTILLGWSPNDLIDPEGGEDGEGAPRYDVPEDTRGTGYSIDQFLNIPVAGAPSSAGAGGNIPLFNPGSAGGGDGGGGGGAGVY
ncbi:MAG: hypothetical protein GY856_28645 [bacterium]|nr:hypothetical protein [bacterium]